eukprot:3409900-Prymnesium_polylepis.1
MSQVSALATPSLPCAPGSRLSVLNHERPIVGRPKVALLAEGDLLQVTVGPARVAVDEPAALIWPRLFHRAAPELRLSARPDALVRIHHMQARAQRRARGAAGDHGRLEVQPRPQLKEATASGHCAAARLSRAPAGVGDPDIKQRDAACGAAHG